MTSLTVRIDENVKKDLQDLLNDLGLDMSTYINMAAKQAIREQRIPFEVSRVKFNSDTMEAFNEVEEMKKNPSIGKSYNNVDDMMKDILK